MKIYAWRVPNTFYRGIASACNMEDLFWAIDEHIDPYQVQIMELKTGISIAYKYVDVWDDMGEECLDAMYSEFESGDSVGASEIEHDNSAWSNYTAWDKYLKKRWERK